MKNPAQRPGLAAEAYAVVRQRILNGDIGIGQVISRRKLAVELQMSFLPVSEALLRLEVEGLLESRARAGTRVRIPSAEDVEGHYVVREALEVQAALRFTALSSPRERAELKRLALWVDSLGTAGDRSTYLAAHYRLHARIAQRARCPVLLEAIERTNVLTSIWYCALRQTPPGAASTRHQVLADALCSGDPAAAAAAVREHLAVGLSHSLQVLEPYFKLRRASGTTFHRSSRRGGVVLAH
jgi:DNA-binding GntR family transcriptional regulator